MLHPKSPRRRRWLKAAALTVVALAVLAALVVGGALLSLRSHAARQAMLARAGAVLTDRLGMDVRAADFHLEPLAGRLSLSDVRLAARGKPPFLTARSVQVAVDLASLRQPITVVRSLEIVDPVVDLSAPLPSLPEGEPGAGPSAPPAVDVLSLAVRGGSVVGAPVPEALAPWVDAWRAGGIAIAGSFRRGTVRATLQVGSVRLRRPRTGELELALAAAAEATPGGAFRLQSLSVNGPGLTLTASADGSLAAAWSAALSFQIDVSPDALLPELATGGEVHVTGEVRGPELRGHATVRAVGIRAEAARRWLDRPTFDRLALGGTTMNLETTIDVSLPTGAPAQVRAVGSTRWRRDDEDLATVGFDASPVGTSGERVAFKAALLPAVSGSRTAEGTVVVASIDHPATATLDEVTIRLDLPDLAAAADEMRRRWPSLPELPPAAPVRGALTAEVVLSGSAGDPRARLQARWVPSAGQRVSASAEGWPLRRAGRATITLEEIRLGAFLAGPDGIVSARIEANGSPTRYSVALTADGRELRASAETPVVDSLHVEAATDGREVRISSFAASLGDRTRLSGQARASLALPVRDVEATLRAAYPAEGVEEAVLHAVLHDGTLDLRVPSLRGVFGYAAAEAVVPLGALDSLPSLREKIATLPLVRAEGPILLSLHVPDLDSCRLAELLPALDRAERVRAGIDATVLVDPGDPTAAVGEVRVERLVAEAQGRTITAPEPLRLLLGGRRLILVPTRLRTAETELAVDATADLAQGWRLGLAPAAEVVTGFDAHAEGSLDARLIQPFLPGVEAEGPVRVAVHASGEPRHPRADVRLEATGATFFWPTPYPTRLDSLVADAGVDESGDALLTAAARLNGGTVTVAGSRATDGRIEAQVRLDDVRYRLDFGLHVVLGGELNAELPPQGRGLVTGHVDVHRGVLDRAISLRHELLPWFLAPKTTVGTEESVLDTIDLNVAVGTDEGIRVRNNLADLRVRWDDLRIRGTAWNPHPEGQVLVEPGGLVFAYGQTIRLDRAVATFTGDPLTDPQLDIATTTSLEDPTLAAGRRSGVLAELEGQAAASGALSDMVAASTAGFVADRLSASLSESLGVARVTVEPILVFGEADPSARLTVARDLNRSATFAISLDLRNAERQTYLLDIHNLRRLPTLTGQVFTNDQGNAGTTVQQSFELGGTPIRTPQGVATVHEVAFDVPPSLPRRALRRAAGLRKGSPFPSGSALDVEMDITQALRELGWPDSQVTVDTTPAKGAHERVDVAVHVVPGERVEFRFTGERPPSGSVPLITSLYRSGYWEEQALDDMRRTTVRVFRSLGYVDPEVKVAATPAPAGGEYQRLVEVHTAPGRRLSLQKITFSGVPAEVAEAVAGRFAGPVEAMELAAGVPDAYRRVEQVLATLGYPSARVAGHDLDPDVGLLTVAVEPGERQRVAAVELEGVDAATRARLAAAIGVQAGDPARRDRIARAAVAIADDLRARGHTSAQVRSSTRSVDGGPAGSVAVVFQITPGPDYRVTGVEFPGRHATADGFARRLAGVKEGGPLRLDLVREGKRRLLETGLFRQVVEEVQRRPDGTAVVGYRLDEKPPLSLAYGLRWESTVGTSAVVDLLDRNVLGRALTVGVRGLYDKNDRAGRLYLGAPNLLASRFSIESFVERRRKITPGDLFISDLIEDTTRATLQVSRPFPAHWVGRLYGRWQRVHIFESEPDPFFPALDTVIKVPYVGTELIYDSRNDPVLATAGTFASVDLSGTGPVLGADITFWRLYAQLSTFRRVTEVGGRSLTWAQSVRVGLADTPADEELIRSERFFAGGEYSVRGYPTESLGPVETLGFSSRPLGGTALLILNEEVRLRLPLDLTGLVFFDAGQVWQRASDMGSRLAKSFGLGLRAATPVGVLRLDAAVPLDRRVTDPSYKLYLGFGTVF